MKKRKFAKKIGKILSAAHSRIFPFFSWIFLFFSKGMDKEKYFIYLFFRFYTIFKTYVSSSVVNWLHLCWIEMKKVSPRAAIKSLIKWKMTHVCWKWQRFYSKHKIFRSPSAVLGSKKVASNGIVDDQIESTFLLVMNYS